MKNDISYITFKQLLYKFKENSIGREWPKKIQLDSSNEKAHKDQNNAVIMRKSYITII